MYKISLIVFVLASVAAGGVKQGSQAAKHLPLDGIPGVILKNRTNSLYLPDRVVVKLMPQTTTSLSKSAFGVSSIDRVLSHALGVTAAPMFPSNFAAAQPGGTDLSLLYTVHFSSPNDPFTLAEELSKLPEVQYAEPWFIYPLTGRTFAPDDSLYVANQQWSLGRVSAPPAWDITRGDSTVVVAIIDTGVDPAHPDLQANLWLNPGETGVDAFGNDKRTNGIDDDGDGYVDDWRGWDFVGSKYETYDPATTKGDNDPSPTASNNDHGTHVAGIVAAVTNNHIGVASLASGCRILPVKVTADDDFRGSGSAYIIAGYPGIAYAARMGAAVINCSWGGDGGSQAEQDIIDYATQHGSLVVAAAGNETSNAFFSPASYRNVLSVAATDQSDKMAYFSNFGDNIDVCAPGVGIFSTLWPSTYASWSGTSMASPLAAALAALVKTRFRSYTSLQVGEQVRVTCDDINSVNPVFTGLLGRGRINAYRALTDSSFPSVRLQTFSVNDTPGGNGNNTAEPGETINIVCSYKNFLKPSSAGATVQLTSDTPYLTVVQGTFSVPSLGTLDTINNKSAPFSVYVEPGVPQSYQARLHLTFVDGSFSDPQAISFLVNPTFATQNVNDIQVTLTNHGRLGFFDYPTNSLGVGFIFNGANHLYEGGLIIGKSSTQIVDIVRDDAGGQDSDFSSRDFYTLKTPGTVSDQDGFTSFSDSAALPANRIGLLVKMHSYAFSDPADSKYVILEYDIVNTDATNAAAGIYAGIFLDWDIGSTTENFSQYDPTRSLGYAFDGDPTGPRAYVGIRALDSAASFRSLVNDLTIDLSRAAKWDWISGGFGATLAGPADIHQVISSGPYTIAPGATRKVGFALVAGDSSLANIQQTADAAKAKWKLIGTVVGIAGDAAGVPFSYQLEQNYPNPFNPTTAIRFQLAASSVVSLRVFDVLGREVAALLDGIHPAGSYTVHWDGSSLPSGIYFCRLQADGVSPNAHPTFIETRKMILLK